MWDINLRRKISQLDEVLLTRMQQSADELTQSGGLLHDYFNGTEGEMGLLPRTFDTSHDSLLVILGSAEMTDTATPRLRLK